MKKRADLSGWRYVMRRGLISLALVVITSCVTYQGHAQTRSFYMGFTPWPWDTGWDAVKSTYDYINDHADIISHHIEEGVPWAEALAGEPFHEKMMESWQLRKQLTNPNLKVFLSVNPINQLRTGIADYRGADIQMPLPDAFKGKAFNHPDVKKAFTAYVRRAIEFFSPDYLAIAIEVNELLENSPAEWPAFVDLYTHTYQETKKIYPNLPVFFTISLHNMTNASRGNPAEKWQRIQQLWKSADIAAVSYYPFLQFPFDLADPIHALDEVQQRTNLPMALSEMGYPAKKNVVEALANLPATPEIQKNVYYVIFNKANEQNHLFVILWCYRDYDALWDRLKGSIPELGGMWRDVGILDGKGKARPAEDIWQLFFLMPKSTK